MSTNGHDESHLAIVNFFTAQLSEHKTWTKEKRAIFSALRKYLIYIGANIVYKNSLNRLNRLGSFVFLSNLKGWFPDDFVKSSTAELRVLIAHRDKSGQNLGKEFAILTLYSHSSKKELEYFKRLLNHKDLIIHDLWFEDELPKKLWEALQKEEQNNVPLEFSREDEGIGVSWYGIDITGDDELDQQLYWKLEDSATELQSFGMYPAFRLRFLTDSLISLSVQN